ncbi:MAG: hypothetical protein M1122_01255 [Candidatus Marsarchaeota archaeon]|jgi:NADH:ubiquinone oxidoreductase subunit 3 (subunit A)|nr:hypothetical protein [Candidatus Marsarchaeota archaeon]
MVNVYIALILFFLLSLFVPSSLLLTSLMIRRRKPTNGVSGLNFESAEQSVGGRISIMSEYLHYFSSFLAFEVVGAIVILWVGAAHMMSVSINAIMIAVLVFAMAMQAVVMLIARKGGHDAR